MGAPLHGRYVSANWLERFSARLDRRRLFMKGTSGLGQENA
jgi:hypothetical protein